MTSGQLPVHRRSTAWARWTSRSAIRAMKMPSEVSSHGAPVGKLDALEHRLPRVASLTFGIGPGPGRPAAQLFGGLVAYAAHLISRGIFRDPALFLAARGYSPRRRQGRAGYFRDTAYHSENPLPGGRPSPLELEIGGQSLASQLRARAKPESSWNDSALRLRKAECAEHRSSGCRNADLTGRRSRGDGSGDRASRDDGVRGRSPIEFHCARTGEANA